MSMPLSTPPRPANHGLGPLSPDADLLRPEHFERLARRIEADTGIKLPLAKKSMVEGRLRARARALAMPSLSLYGDFLFTGGGLASEFDAIVDSVTTNKTDFFRENDHFALLRTDLVPALLPRLGQSGALKLWSAAASNGAEAYTIAMVLADLQRGRPFDFRVLGTDLNAQVLGQARRAIYPIDMIGPIPPPFRRAYTMLASDPEREEFRIVPELRRLVRFVRLNLTAQTYEVDRDFDVIFCRNCLIYFERPVQRAVVHHLTRHLRPGGFLLLGHAEAMAGNDHPDLQQIAPTVYQFRGS